MMALSPEILSRRVADFSHALFSVSHLSGPPYPILSSEIDIQRTLDMAQGGQRIRANHHALDPDTLRRARVMLASVPEDDFDRVTIVDGVPYDELMGDVMGSMTGKANPPGRRLRSVSPNYAIEFIRANLPIGRIHVSIPKTKVDFQTDVTNQQPDILLLSGLNVNIRTLLDMALFARQQGVQEVWLGGDAALGPYKILDEMFDRVIWGPAEEYLYQQLAGDVFPGHRHPAASQMLAGVKWLMAGEGDSVHERSFETLHLALRLGCTQSCDYCAEGIKSNRGTSIPATTFEEAKQIIDDAYAMGIRRVYFVDPDFGRLWQDDLEGKVLRYLASKGMKWSCLTNVITLRKHGPFMIEHGLASIYLGIESFAPSHRGTGARGGNVLKVLDRAWQNQDETIQLIHEMTGEGVLVFGLYILFNPGETEEDVLRGIETLKDVVPLSQISTNQPFPGTEEFRTAAAQRLFFNLDPDSVRYGQMVWAPNGVGGPVHDPERVAQIYIQAQKAVNDLSRPGGFFDRQRSAKKKGGGGSGGAAISSSTSLQIEPATQIDMADPDDVPKPPAATRGRRVGTSPLSVAWTALPRPLARGGAPFARILR